MGGGNGSARGFQPLPTRHKFAHPFDKFGEFNGTGFRHRPLDDARNLALRAPGRPVGKLGQSAATDLLVDLCELAGHSSAPIGPKNLDRLGQGGGNPMR